MLTNTYFQSGATTVMGFVDRNPDDTLVQCSVEDIGHSNDWHPSFVRVLQEVGVSPAVIGWSSSSFGAGEIEVTQTCEPGGSFTLASKFSHPSSADLHVPLILPWTSNGGPLISWASRPSALFVKTHFSFCC